MNLGLQGKTALISGGSRGIGKACAKALAEEGVTIFLVARGADAVNAAARELQLKTGVAVTPIVADVSTEQGRELVVKACPAPDILLTNAAGPAPGDFRTWNREAWLNAIDTNMLAPIALIEAFIDGMSERGFGRIVNITTAGMKAPPAGFALSSSTRLGLTGFVASLAREVSRANVTINNILPGATQTERFSEVMGFLAKSKGLDIRDASAGLLASIPAGRFALPDEIGHAFAFLCSAHSGYITGQNLTIDGGAYKGLF